MTLQWESRPAEYPHADDGLKIKSKSITPSIYIQILLTDRSTHFLKKVLREFVKRSKHFLLAIVLLILPTLNLECFDTV